MGRKRKRLGNYGPTGEVETVVGAPEVVDAAPLGGDADAPKPTFQRAPKCPRCGSTQTRATSTVGNIQYRQCSLAICRNNFKQVAVQI